MVRTPRLPVLDWTDAPRRFKWTRPFRRKTKSGFCACAITFQTHSSHFLKQRLAKQSIPKDNWSLERKLLFRMVCLSVCLWRDNLQLAKASSFTRFLDHTQRRTTVGRTPLNEWTARRRELYLTTHNIHDRQTSMPPVGFEPTISTGERPQIYTLDRAVTGTGV